MNFRFRLKTKVDCTDIIYRMSLFYKRLIALKITEGILGSLRSSERKHLERNIGRLVRVKPVRKDVISDSQFVIDFSGLLKCLNGKAVNLDQVHSESGINVEILQDVAQFKVEPVQFTQKVLENIRCDKNRYGYVDHDADQKERVCVEFSSPNIAKPFHVGHLRSTIIGNVISNLYEAAGHDVKRINFVGDWGTQFGLLSLGLMRYSDMEELRRDPLLEFFNVYVKINQDVKSECGKAAETTSQTYQEGMELFTRLEQGDESMKVVWKMINDLSTPELNKIYERLGVHFTHTMPESAYQNRTEEVLNRLSDAGLLQYDSDGVGLVKMADSESIGRASIVKSDGSSLYLTRDIASALDRQDMFTPDRMLYVVEQGQRGHFIKLTKILEQLDIPWAKRSLDEIHIRFGRVKGMSTRQGNAVFLRDVLDEAKSKVMESMVNRSTTRVTDDLESVAESLGVTAIILQDLKSHRANDYTFSWEKMLSFKSDSGVFVQYCHARLCSMLSNCGVEVTDEIDANCLLKDNIMLNVVLHLARYADVFEDSLSKHEPHHLVQYLFKLCHLINAAYSSCPVKGECTDIAQARLLVFECSRQVLSNCLQVLGLQPLEKI